MKYLLPILALFLVGCAPPVQSASGTKMAIVNNINLDEQGHTVEQNNIIKKTQVESQIDKKWYIYVISPFDHNVIMQSVVVGKVTSSGKRLTPKTLSSQGMSIKISNEVMFTQEIPSEDGTFGDSTEYIYWIDDKGRNRRHFLLHGQIIHLVDQPMTKSELLGEMQ